MQKVVQALDLWKNQQEEYSMNLHHYAQLSKLFEYPDEEYINYVNEVKEALAIEYPLASNELEEFLKLLPTGTYDIQELYTKSFEVQAITSLEIGYVLYGDEYTRGEILANLSDEHKNVNNALDGELADHLGNVLRLIPKMQDIPVRDDLVKLMLGPAIEIMMDEYNPAIMEKKNELYQKQYKTVIVASFPLVMFVHLFKALYIVLDKDFTLLKKEKSFQDASFFGFLKSELEVEEGKNSANGINSCTTFNVDGTPSSCGSSCGAG